MNTYYLFGSYTRESLKHISRDRTDRARELIQNFGGEIILMHATLGCHDLVLIINFPDNKAAMKASVALTRDTGIRFETLPAVTVTDFDELVREI